MLSSLIKSNFRQKKVFQSEIEEAFHFHYGASLDVARQNPVYFKAELHWMLRSKIQYVKYAEIEEAFHFHYGTPLDVAKQNPVGEIRGD